MQIQDIPDEVKSFDGTFKRFDIDKSGDKAGWFVGHEWNYREKKYSIFNAGNWKTGEKIKQASWDKELEISDLEFRKKALEKQREQERLVALQKQKENLDAKEKAQKELKTFKVLNDENHFYIKKKRLQLAKLNPLSRPLLDHSGNLVIPMVDESQEVVGYQLITESGKFFQRGQKIKGCFHTLGDIDRSKIIYIAEGFATALTVFMATGKPCVITFTANNLSPVIKNLFDIYPEKVFMIAADRDQSGAGEKYAKIAKRENSNTNFVLPEFKLKGSALSDFNDLYLSADIETVRAQLEGASTDVFAEIEFFGFDEGNYYFFSKRKDMICPISFNQIKDGRLAELADECYWARRYVAKRNKQGEPTNNCDWIKTAEKIAKDQQLKKGYFDKSKIRGFGLWTDRSRKVFNTGKKLFVNEKPINFGEREGFDYLYFPSKINQIEFTKDIKPSIETIIAAVNEIDFKSDQDRCYFLGFIFQAKIFSALNWRTHLWISAPHGTGKSTVMSFLHSLLDNSMLVQDTTASGLSQSIKSDAMPTLVDEGEGDEKNTQQLLSLARLSSSNGGAMKLRGTMTNTGAVSYNFNSVFCFASIRLPELNGASESRFVWISLEKKQKYDNGVNSRRQAMMDACEGLSDDLFLYAVQNLSQFQAYVAEAKQALCEQYEFSARLADTHANLIAGYACMAQVTVAEAVLRMVTANLAEESAESSKVDDRDVFFDTLMQLDIPTEKGDSRPLWELLKEVQNPSPLNPRAHETTKQLVRCGIYVRKNKWCYDVVFDHRNIQLKKLFAKTEFRNPKRQMGQDSRRFEEKKFTINGSRLMCMSVGIEQVPDYMRYE